MSTEDTNPLLCAHPEAEKINSSTSASPAADPLATELRNWWSWDVASIVFSTAAIVGMCIILLLSHNKPLPQWATSQRSPFAGIGQRITYNAVLEIFSTLCKLCLGFLLTRGLSQLTWVWFFKERRPLEDFRTFSAASRQSLLGSARLAWRLRGWYGIAFFGEGRYFAALGAVTIIAIQGFGFFVQQLITFPVSVIPTLRGGPPLLAVANHYNTSYKQGDVGPSMKANIWASLYTIDPNFYWNTQQDFCMGYCTWRDYFSLAVCTRCSSISSLLTIDCPDGLGLHGNVTGCNVTLPNGLRLGTTSNLSNTEQLMVVSTAFEPLVYNNYSHSFGIIQSITAPYLWYQLSHGINASECALIPCVQQYEKAEVIMAVDEDAESLREVLPEEDSSQEAAGPSSPVFENGARIWDNSTFDNVTGSKIILPQKKIPQGVYQMAAHDFNSLQQYIKALFNGGVTWNNTVSYYAASGDGAVVADAASAMEAIFQPYPNGCMDVFGNQMWDWNICSLTYAAQAMTKTMRDYSWMEFNESVEGQEFEPKAVVSVAWIWLVPIVVLWLFTIILTFGTMWASRVDGLRVWRDDPLVLLSLHVQQPHGLQGHETRIDVSEENLDKMAQMSVQLHLTGTVAELA